VPRSTYFYQPRPESAENQRLLRALDELYLKLPLYGGPQDGRQVRRGPLSRPAADAHFGIEAPYPKPHLSRLAPVHQIYPYVLRGVAIERPNQVWSTDITYLPMRGGFLYLVVVMDWYSRFVLC
jgi:putative transposase